MKFILVFHCCISLLLTAAVALRVGPSAAFSFALGCGVILFNLLVLVYSLPRILAKKKVALPLAVIVIKFAILGLIVREVAVSKSINLWWFAAGLALVVVSTVATSVFTSMTTTSISSGASLDSVETYPDSSSKVEY